MRLDSHYKRMIHFQDEVPQHYLASVKQQIKCITRSVEEDADEKAETAAEEVGDDVIASATNRRTWKKPLKFNLSAQPCQKEQYLSLIQKLKMLRESNVRAY